MKTMLLFCLFILSFPALAQKAQVLILDDQIKSEKLEENFNVERVETQKKVMPNLDERDSLLGKAAPFESWDELKKDLFFMDLKSNSLADLEKKYPDVPKADLKRLKEKRK